jgi:ABC-type phosphate transport system substrate-binding protein
MQYSVRFLFALLVCLSPAYPLARLSVITGLPALAQTESFDLPETVPAGTSLSVESSPNMAASTRALQEQFEIRYDGSQVTVEESSSDQAIQALLAGDVDLAAIGRPLTEAELEQGLVSVPLLREKIAIIIGPDNPFDGTLTFEQFASMFRGEITDWSEVGGPQGQFALSIVQQIATPAVPSANTRCFSRLPSSQGQPQHPLPRMIPPW